MTGPVQSWRIGVDTGGTFTDLVLADAVGRIAVFKVPSIPEDPSAAVLIALEQAAATVSISVRELLEGCALFVHGSTIATNTVLEGKGALVGMVSTAGFRDSIEVRRGARDDPWDHRTPYPPVLVPRYLRCPVRGRIDKTGQEREALEESDVDSAVVTFDLEKVESVAVCLFNSYLNSAHERRVAARISRHKPQLALSISSSIAPLMGEYERSSTTVLNAYIAPRALAYLRKLDARLAALGLRKPLLLIQSNGGTISVTELGDRPVALLLSGPAAGVGALNYYCSAIGSSDLVSMEIGGTSCDVILMSGGNVAFTDVLDIGGYKCVTPSVEVHTIGAGGGTIAHVDAAGLLQVGPKGAGAQPGPACYGKGGDEATVTDAQVVLGRLKPGFYGSGAVHIDGVLAAHAIERSLARPLGLDIPSAAAGIIQLMEQKLLHAVQRVSSHQGYDPRRFTLVAGGGAGPLHAAAVGRALGCAQVYVPRLAGAFCALGMLHTDIRHDYVAMCLGRLDDIADSTLDALFNDLEATAIAALQREGFPPQERRLSRALDLRYLGQQWDLTVDADATMNRCSLRRRFENKHQLLFGHTQPDGIVELTKLRVTGSGLIQPLVPVELPAATVPAACYERRFVWVDATTKWQETPIYSGNELAPGNTLCGPAIIDEQTTTVLIGQGDTLLVDHTGNYLITLAR